MKRIAFILPYFGKFNNYFDLFIKSCEFNSDIDWLVFTDDKSDYKYPSNVIVKYMSFEELQKHIRSKFDFDVCIDRPYKLCDYKPMYGYLFEEYLEGYDFWGYCDCDVIFGNIRKFVTDEVLNKYDKLFCLGHCSIYKNTRDVNKAFRNKINGKERFKDVLRTKKSCTFDEDYLPNNINEIFEEYGYKVLKDDYSANISNRYSDLRIVRYDKLSGEYLTEKNRSFFVFDNGKIFRYCKKFGSIKKTEYMYIHLQSREMKKNIVDLNKFKIAANVFLELEVDEVNLSNIDYIRAKYFSNYKIKFLKKELAFWKKRLIEKLRKD